VPGVVTGKPIEIGGSHGRREATGRGVITCLLEACREIGLALAGARLVVQGFGQVGRAAARIATQHGAKLVGLSDVSGGVHAPGGLDIDEVERWIAENGQLKGLPGAEHCSNAALLELPCDVLIPAAVQNQLTAENAERIQARLIVEGANGPTTLEADAILSDRGATVVPDILANAGGVTVSYFEWVQGLQQFFWTEQEVNDRLIRLMQRASKDVWGVSRDKGVNLRTAALIRGIERVTEAKRRRGVFP
jgi:glutamate dehydrogenase (NAD(P)+)